MDGICCFIHCLSFDFAQKNNEINSSIMQVEHKLVQKAAVSSELTAGFLVHCLLSMPCKTLDSL